MTLLQTKLETTEIAGLQAMGMHGEAVWRSFMQIRDVVGSRLGPEAAQLFAAPSLHENGGKIDWYSTVAGAPIAWNEATPAQRETIVSGVERIYPALSSLSESLINAGSEPAKIMGNHIAHALHLSDERNVYLVGDQVVITLWGFARQPNEKSVLPHLRELMNKPAVLPPPPPPPIEIEPRAAKFWLFRFGLGQLLTWLTLLALAAALLYFGPPSCSPKTNLTSEAPEIAPAPQTDKPSSGVTVPKGEKLVVPKDALDSGDMSFLMGNWRSITGLHNSRTGEPLDIYFNFNADGSGEARVLEQSSSQTCRGQARASLDKSILTIENSKGVLCPNDGKYSPIRVVCNVEPGGAANCVIHQRTGSDVTVTLIRQ